METWVPLQLALVPHLLEVSPPQSALPQAVLLLALLQQLEVVPDYHQPVVASGEALEVVLRVHWADLP
jgi:hypothetical protein